MFLKDLSEYSLQSLRIFAYVSSMGSVAEAAEALSLSQPAVSLQISNLEKQLGFALFERSGRRNVLTLRGQELYQKVLPALERLEMLLVDAREDEHLTKPKLYLGSVEGIGEYWLLNRFNIFKKSHPETRLFLEIGEAEVLSERLMTGRSAIVITTRKLEAANIVSEVFLDERLVPVGKKSRIDELQGIIENSKTGDRFWEKIDWIGYGDSFSRETWALRWLESVGAVIDRRFMYRHQVNSYAIIRQLLLDGVGVCVAPKHTVEDLLTSGDLAMLETKKFPSLRNRLYISYREQSLTRTAKDFHDWILKAAREANKA